MGLAYHPACRYQAMEINGADRMELVLLLYKGAIKELHQAKGFLDTGEIENRVRCINKAGAIIGELKTALDFDRGGDLAKSLDHLYTYMMRRLIQANLRRDGEILEEIAGLLGTLLPAWEETRLKNAAEKADHTPFASQAGGTGDRLSLSSVEWAGSAR